MTSLLYLESEIKDIVAFSHVLRSIEADGFFEPRALTNTDDTLAAGGQKTLALAFDEMTAAAFRKKGCAVILVLEDDERSYEKLSEEGGMSYDPDAVLIGIGDVDVRWLRHVFERHYDIPWVILETERTVVRELGEADLDMLYELYGAPGVTEYVEPLYDRDKEAEYQRNYRKNVYAFYGYGMWGVFDRDDGRLIGRCGIDPHERGPELGYIIHPDRQRQGLGYEVCLAIVEYAKNELDIEELWLKADGDNTPSVRLAGKLGFVYDGDDFYSLKLKC